VKSERQLRNTIAPSFASTQEEKVSIGKTCTMTIPGKESWGKSRQQGGAGGKAPQEADGRENTYSSRERGIKQEKEVVTSIAHLYLQGENRGKKMESYGKSASSGK